MIWMTWMIFLNLLNLNSVHIAIHEVSARWMKRWRRLLPRAPGPESTDSMDWTDTMDWTDWDGRHLDRVRGRKWILKRKNASCWSNNDSNGWRCSFGNLGIGKIYPKSLQSIFTKVRSPFFFFCSNDSNESTVCQYVILAVQLQLLRTFKSEKALQSFLEAQLLCPGLARPRSNASLWSKQKLQGWGHKSVLIPWIYCRKLEHPWIIIQWKLCKRQIK